MIKTKLDEATTTPRQRIAEVLMQPAFYCLFLLAVIFALLADRRTSPGISLYLYVDAAPLLATLGCLAFLGFSGNGRRMVVATFPTQKSERDKAWRIWKDISLGVWLFQLLTLVSAPTLLPMSPLTLILRSFFQQRRLARELEFLWIALNAILAFRLQYFGHSRLGFILAIGCAVSAFVSLASNLVIRRGVVRLYTLAPDIITPGKVFSWALIVIVSFGCIHYHFAQADSNAYKGITTWQDGLYFSVVTFATVGYGDVYPVTDVARWATMAEILSGLVLLVIAVNATVSVWLQRNQEVKQDAANNQADESASSVKEANTIQSVPSD